MPTDVVGGVGAVVLPVPPLGTVYQYSVLLVAAVAVRAVAVAFWQKLTGEVATGAAGVGLTVAVTVVAGEVQPDKVAVTR